MRLTLRTMLAYLDDILEPDDYHDLSKKISESEFATGLVHRTRDVMRRLRLGAPNLWGHGMGLDPNTVADYLDNTLAADRVPDFEKVCLESDVHLAEVTASHQILTLVLGEPAHVEPALRKRLYNLGGDTTAGVDTQHAPTPPPISPPVGFDPGVASGEFQPFPPPLPMPPVKTAREKPVIPDYLRESARSKWRTAAAIVIVLALIAGAVVMAIGPRDVGNVVAGLFGGTRNEPAVNQPAAPSTTPNGPTQVTESARTTGPSANLPLPIEAAATSPVASQPVDNQSVEAQPGNEPGPEIRQPSVVRDAPPAQTVEPATTPSLPAAADVVKGPDLTPAPAAGSGDTPPIPSPAPVVADAGADGVGRFVSEEDVLLRLDSAGSWKRLPSRAPLMKHDKLLVLPTFRPTVLLGSGMTLVLLGETMAELEGTDADGVMGIKLAYGRIVLMPAGKADSRIRLRIDDRQGSLMFGEPDSIVAVEVRRFLLPGANPEMQPGQPAIDLYCTNGSARWFDGANTQPQSLAAPARVVLAAHPAEAEASKEMPKWISADTISDIEKRASLTLYQKIDDQNPVLTLKELAVERREEIRFLAIRSLAHFGHFDEFVNVLSDQDRYTMWPAYITIAQTALARGPEVAAKVRVAFEKKSDDHAAELYRMLWGYSANDLEAGGAAKLVEYLDHEELPFRVLSFWNLKNITGTTLLYSPQNPPAARRQSSQRWKEKLRDGQIVPKAAPQSRKPAEAPPS